MKAKLTLAVRGTRAANGKSLSPQNWNRESRHVTEGRSPKATNTLTKRAARLERRSRRKNQRVNEKEYSCKTKFAVGFQKTVSPVPLSRKRPRSQVPATWRQHLVRSPLQPF